PEDLVLMGSHYRAGRVAEAEAIHRRLYPLFKALFIETSPAPVKYALSALGSIAPDLRLPLVGLKPETVRAVDAALDGLGLRAPARAAH
ncbi:MAG TPA: dihydrodipicolinate synthase family protein, partial [Candidatus Eisenbacteria bacterium]|nr:dihydrodipicolinate synthase family protein [Candidatus Eisenbacteria bacterium]